MRRGISYALVVFKWIFAAWLIAASGAAIQGITFQELVRRIADRSLAGGVLLAVVFVGLCTWLDLKGRKTRASQKKS
mgnify:CR=1 FL=1